MELQSLNIESWNKRPETGSGSPILNQDQDQEHTETHQIAAKARSRQRREPGLEPRPRQNP